MGVTIGLPKGAVAKVNIEKSRVGAGASNLCKISRIGPPRYAQIGANGSHTINTLDDLPLFGSTLFLSGSLGSVC